MKLDIGCGDTNTQMKGDWTHIDIDEYDGVDIVCDFGKIPLPDDCADEIFLGDVMEHIPRWRYDEVLPEFARLLKPGGIISIRTPNIELAMRAYSNGTLAFPDALQLIYARGVDDKHQHYHGFSGRTLLDLLGGYGFTCDDIKLHNYWIHYRGTI
jgi:predicted SAM-dependent methyltransferase